MLFITLTPFDYHWPERFYIVTFWQPLESLQNIFLFIPFGYLTASLLHGTTGHKMPRVVLIGFLLSLFIETNQLFIYDRYTSPNDIFNNTLGALLGGLCLNLFDRLSAFREKGGALLRIPLMHVVLLLIPLLWLNAVSTGKNVNRLWSALLPGIAAVIIMAAIYRNGRKRAPDLRKISVAIFFSAWFLAAYMPQLLWLPGRTIIFYILLAAGLWILLRRTAHGPVTEQRYEIPTLKKVLPVFALYTLFVTAWPFNAFQESFQLAFMGDLFTRDTSLRYIFRQMEYMAACALAGYILAEVMNRKGFRAGRYALWLMLGTLLPEIWRGFHPDYGANVTHWFIAVFNGAFGGLVYFYALSVYLERNLHISSTHKTYRPKPEPNMVVLSEDRG